MNVLVVIPARLESTRLAKKALADIAGKTMVERVFEQAKKSNIGDVVVATCGHEIANVIEKAGGRAIITDPVLPSGTDRVWAAYVAMGKPTVDVIIGLQGDLPFLNPTLLEQIIKPLQNPDIDVATLGTLIKDSKDLENPNNVKIVMDKPHHETARAIYFSRAAVPYGAQEFYHHIGVYAYRPKALESFIHQPPCYLEKTERLEQLRFLQHGFRIEVVVVDDAPLSIDTSEDLQQARQQFNT